MKLDFFTNTENKNIQDWAREQWWGAFWWDPGKWGSYLRRGSGEYCGVGQSLPITRWAPTISWVPRPRPPDPSPTRMKKFHCESSRVCKREGSGGCVAKCPSLIDTKASGRPKGECCQAHHWIHDQPSPKHTNKHLYKIYFFNSLDEAMQLCMCSVNEFGVDFTLHDRYMYKLMLKY